MLIKSRGLAALKLQWTYVHIHCGPQLCPVHIAFCLRIQRGLCFTSK